MRDNGAIIPFYLMQTACLRNIYCHCSWKSGSILIFPYTSIMAEMAIALSRLYDHINRLDHVPTFTLDHRLLAPHNPPTRTIFQTLICPSMKWYVNSKKIGTNFIFWPLIVGYPKTFLKSGDRVTQTFIFAILVYKSTHAIYHIEGN